MGTVGADLCSFSSTVAQLPAGPYNTGGTLYVLIRSNYGGVRGYHATQLVELRRLIAKSGPQVQGAVRKWFAPGLRPTEYFDRDVLLLGVRTCSTHDLSHDNHKKSVTPSILGATGASRPT